METPVQFPGRDEGPVVIPPDQVWRDYKEVRRAFFRGFYDYRGELRAKNRHLAVLASGLLLTLLMFAAYVARHARVETYWIDTSAALAAPYRVLEYGPTVPDEERLLLYFFGRIPPLLFSYDKETLIPNREEVGMFLAKPVLDRIAQQTEALIREYGQEGRFLKGNPSLVMQNVLIPSVGGNLDAAATQSVRSIQVFAALTIRSEMGRAQEEPRHLVITFRYNLRSPRSRDELFRNPLGIRILEWDIVEQPRQPLNPP